MKPVNAAIEAAYTADPYRHVAFMIAEIQGDSVTYRFTDAPILIDYDGEEWDNVWFSISDLVQDAEGEQTCAVTFEDASRTMRSIAFNENLSDKVIIVREVWANENNDLIGDDVIVHGVIDGFVSEGEEGAHPTATLQVRSLFASSGVAVGPTQDYQVNCRYREFKGAQCKYAGAATTCDRKYSTCLTYGNTINFGGFRFALSEGQTIVWGAGVAEQLRRRPSPSYDNPPDPSGSTSGSPEPDSPILTNVPTA